MLRRRINILQIASHKNLLRGGAVQMASLAEELFRREHKISCVFNKEGILKEKDLKTLEPLRSAGIALEFFDMRKLKEIWRFRRWLKTQQFDVVHAHRQQATVFVWLATFALRREKIPPIVAQRGTVYPLRRWSLEKLAYSSRRIKKIIAVANAVKEALIKNDKIPPEKIEVIYGGVDEKKFNPDVDGRKIRKEFAIAPEEKVITNIAALVEKKGYPFFFQAVAEVCKLMPSIKVIVVGAGKKDKFVDLLNQLNLNDKIIFTGHREDIAEIIAASDLIVCSATKGEGLTGSLREALAMKKPVVTTNIAGNPELIIDEKTGLVVPPANSYEMAQAILRLLRDESFARKLAEQGYLLVRQNFLNTHRTDKIESLYYALLGQHLKCFPATTSQTDN